MTSSKTSASPAEDDARSLWREARGVLGLAGTDLRAGARPIEEDGVPHHRGPLFRRPDDNRRARPARSPARSGARRTDARLRHRGTHAQRRRAASAPPGPCAASAARARRRPAHRRASRASRAAEGARASGAPGRDGSHGWVATRGAEGALRGAALRAGARIVDGGHRAGARAEGEGQSMSIGEPGCTAARARLPCAHGRDQRRTGWACPAARRPDARREERRPRDERQGRRRQELRRDQPDHGALRAPAAASACSTPTSTARPSPPCSASPAAPSRSTARRSSRSTRFGIKLMSHRLPPRGPEGGGHLARADAPRRAPAVHEGRALGRARLPRARPAPGHGRRRAHPLAAREGRPAR